MGARMTQTYLVTGGAGFIGSHLVRELLRRGHRVKVLDNFSSGRRENLAEVAADLVLTEGDIRDPDTLAAVMRGVDRVLHQAALISVVQSVADPLLCHAINDTGTLNVLLAARDAGVASVVIASSAAVYGDLPGQPKRETMVRAPTSPYGWSKCSAELYGGVFSRLYHLPVTCLRYFNVYGPRQDPKSPYAAVIPIFASRMSRGQNPVVFGDGSQSRDFVFIGDVVQANLLAADTAAGGDVYNVGSGVTVTLLSLIDELNRALGTSLSPEFAAARSGDIHESSADIERIRQQLGYQPTTTLSDGLAETVAWFEHHRR